MDRTNVSTKTFGFSFAGLATDPVELALDELHNLRLLKRRHAAADDRPRALGEAQEGVRPHRVQQKVERGAIDDQHCSLAQECNTGRNAGSARRYVVAQQPRSLPFPTSLLVRLEPPQQKVHLLARRTERVGFEQHHRRGVVQEARLHADGDGRFLARQTNLRWRAEGTF